MININNLYNNLSQKLDASQFKSFDKLYNTVLKDDYVLDDVGTQPVRFPKWELKDGRTFDDVSIKEELDKPPMLFRKNFEWYSNNPIPNGYLDYINEIYDSGLLNSYTNIHGDFNVAEVMLHNTLQTYINPWHSHYTDGMHLHVLTHMGSKERFTDDGSLLVGRAKSDINIENLKKNEIYWYKGEVDVLNKMNCNHGDMSVFVNNDPTCVHMVSSVIDQNRYTLMLAFGYKDNI